MAASHRVPSAPVDPIFLNRWSPRSFEPTPLTTLEIGSLLEAARWAPSAGNEQPWLFVFARTPEDRDRFVGALTESNRRWAGDAPLLVFLFARRWRRARSDGRRPNPHASFDAGAAWMSLALEAEILGLSAHGMAGFDPAKAHEATGVPPDEFEALAAIAVGHRAAPSRLPDDLAGRELPSPRRPLAEISAEGRYTSLPP